MINRIKTMTKKTLIKKINETRQAQSLFFVKENGNDRVEKKSTRLVFKTN
jgi:hypothetical protein